jgi:hypothetical protein
MGIALLSFYSFNHESDLSGSIKCKECDLLRRASIIPCYMKLKASNAEEWFSTHPTYMNNLPLIGLVRTACTPGCTPADVVEKPEDVDTICGRGSTTSPPPPTCTTLYVTVPEKKNNNQASGESIKQ